jgi:dienelactone hydrolase
MHRVNLPKRSQLTMLNLRTETILPTLCSGTTLLFCLVSISPAEQPALLAEVPEIASSWQDLTAGIASPDDWQARSAELRTRYLEIMRDAAKPARPPLELQVHEEVLVDGRYRRRLISYAVDTDERAHAYLGIPLHLEGPAPGIVALHGTHPQGMERAAGLLDNPDKAYLDHLCRRGYVVIAPEHFVSGRRTPAAGAYDTTAFYERHPDWTAVGKFTYEHSIAVDVLQAQREVDGRRIGALGHSLGGHGTIFLAAYDDRIRAAAANCGGAFFRHNPDVLQWARDRWYVYFKHLRDDLEQGKAPPIDFHEIIALIAPRAFLDISAINDGHPATQRQRVVMLMEVMKVYQLTGAAEQFAFYVHGQGHAVPHPSRQLLYGWMDTHLKPPAATATRLVQ